MIVPLLLFAIRLLSAALLLAFVFSMSYLVLQEVRGWGQVAAEPTERARLRVIADGGGGPVVGREFPLLTVTNLGRGSRNHIVIDDTYASSKHARITRRGQRFWLEDLDSRNGTLLNGESLQDAVLLSAEDVIAIGRTQFEVQMDG